MRNDIVLSSRVRLARNYEDIPFDVSHRPDFAAVCISRTVNAMKVAGQDKGFELYRLRDLPDLSRRTLAERGMISRDLLALAEEVKTILLPSAAQKNVAITVSGEGFRLTGVRRLLHEILYNLCDNAIKYNSCGGSVTVHVENSRLVVSDTGIGIPAEHQSRIFERFYRVDKSHSKASGGTGLGLSIVKHAVAYHKAEIQLESTPNKGTTITIQF